MANVNVRRKIEEIMQAEGMNAKTFAEEVGISAGTLSNILGGRNNPSLDVVQNVLNRFRTISADWLVLDVGPMYRKQGIDSPATMELPFDKPAEAPQTPLMQPKQPAPQPVQPIIQQKTVQKIAIFYTDGTFEER
jgi:transcriptional regulator with XRE-family HTH domain